MLYIYKKEITNNKIDEDILPFVHIFSEINEKINKGNYDFSFNNYNVIRNYNLTSGIYDDTYIVAAMIYKYVLKKEEFVNLYKYYTNEIMENIGNTYEYCLIIKILDGIIKMDVDDFLDGINEYEEIIEESDGVDCKYNTFYCLYNYLIENYQVDFDDNDEVQENDNINISNNNEKDKYIKKIDFVDINENNKENITNIPLSPAFVDNKKKEEYKEFNIPIPEKRKNDTNDINLTINKEEINKTDLKKIQSKKDLENKIINKIKKVYEKVDYEDKLIITNKYNNIDKYIHNISEMDKNNLINFYNIGNILERNKDDKQCYKYTKNKFKEIIIITDKNVQRYLRKSYRVYRLVEILGNIDILFKSGITGNTLINIENNSFNNICNCFVENKK